MQFFSIYGPRIFTEQESDSVEENLPVNINDMVQHILNVITNQNTESVPSSSSVNNNTNNTNDVNTPPPPPTNTQSTQNTFSFLNPLSSSPQSSSGLTIRELSENTKLETFKINEDEMIEEGMANDSQCVICHMPIENDSIVRKINLCGHIFHPECVDRWFERNSSCPLCRQIIINRPSSTNENIYTIPISFSYV